jgi:putative transposase
MTAQTPLPTIWHITDDLWKLIAPILGREKQPGTPGRPATPFRRILDAIIYVLRTGCQWQAIPRQEYAPGSTVHGRFRQWVENGVFERAWVVLLEHYDELVGIEWKWQAMDGVITKAPLGGEQTGPSPVDRGKSGTKRSLLTDRRGAPLGIVITGANTNDKTVALETIDSIRVARPEKVVYRLHHLCLDKGYDYEDVIEGVLARDYILHLRRKGEAAVKISAEKRHPARRWVVERTHAWHNKFRRLLVRWERKVDHYKALVQLASVLVIYRLIAAA